MDNAVRPVPKGYATVTPWIAVRGAAGLLDYLEEAFGAQELARVLNADGTIGHAEARIGDSVVMAFDARPEWPVMPALIRLYVEDADTVYRRALAAGATGVTEVTELFFGDRVGRVRDPFGNIWWIQTRVKDVPEDELWAAADDPAAVEAMNYVQNSLDQELRHRTPPRSPRTRR